MRAPARIAAFAATLGVVFGVAALAGGALAPLQDPAEGRGHSEDGHMSADPAAVTPTGLGVAEARYALAPEATSLPQGRATELRFRILGPDGAAVTDFGVEHERRMHLILVRRDLTGYQHLHPTRDAAGRWTVRLRLPEGGVYRAYAGFTTGGSAMTLATDLFAGGAFRPVPLPGPSRVDTTDGYRTELSVTGAVAGEAADLVYRLDRDGRRLDGVEPYLGADGHLVALREGDLAFLHVHPEESDAAGTIRFGAALPSAGRYRLFLQFKHEGRVRTVAHTLEVSR